MGDGERWGDRKEVSTKAVVAAEREQWRPSAALSRRPAETSHGNRCWDVGAGALTPHPPGVPSKNQGPGDCGKPRASKSYWESAGISVQGGYGAGMGQGDREVGVLKFCG